MAKTKEAKRILVTGGAGFLGTNLCKYLLKEGHRVTCLDNFSSGSRRNLLTMLDHQNFSLFDADVCDPLTIAVDEIYNLACCASPKQYQEDPLKTLSTCTVGVANLLEYAVERNVKVLQSSTSEVYGNPSVHPQSEDYFGNVNPIGPRACYDEGKRCAETLCMDYHRIHGARVKIARIFNTYGPHMQPQDGRVVSNFIVQALLNKPITIYGDGSQTRSFCYVDDLIRGFIALMDTPDQVVGPINLGNPAEFTVLELAHQIIQITGSSSSIVFKPLPVDDPLKRQPEIKRAKRYLDWSPEIPLHDGLIDTINYFDQVLTQDLSFASLSHQTKQVAVSNEQRLG